MPALNLIRELRYTIRSLRQRWAFSTLAIATVAVALGVSAAMFTFVNGMLLRPLPYPDPDRIVRVLERHPTGALNGISTLNYLDWASQNSVFEYMAAEAAWRPTLSGGEEPIGIRAALVSAHYFDIFGTKAALGRTFGPADEEPGSDRVVLLSHRLWESRFGSHPATVGGPILLDGEVHTVVGVLPDEGPFDRTETQIWKPVAFEPTGRTRDFRWLGASAKLKSGVTLAQARAEMDVIGRRLGEAYPESNKGWGVAVDRLQDVLVGPQVASAIRTLFVATVLVVLIACVNLANLGLARGISRQGEFAVRAALGASRWQLARQSVLENLVIGLSGGIAGLAVAFVAVRWVGSLIPPRMLPPAVNISIDGAVVLFTLAMGVVSGVLFGLVPAAQTTRVSLMTVLREPGIGPVVIGRTRRLRGRLVVAEVALSFVLLVGAGLLSRSSSRLLDIHPGFDALGVLTAGLPLSRQQHPDPVALNAYLDSMVAAVEAIPGVEATGLTSALPLEGWGYGVTYAPGERPGNQPADRRRGFFKIVSPQYFDVLRIRLLQGRLLADSDRTATSPVVVINDVLAKRDFPGEDPVGRRIQLRAPVFGTEELGPEVGWEIVGVVANERITGLDDDISAGMYVSNRQSPTYAINLVVRAAVPPQSLHRPLRSALDRVDKGQALSDIRPLEQIVDESLRGNRIIGTLLTLFAALALALALVGIYGVVAYTAAQRAHELGIRAALGARRIDLRLLVLWGGMRLVLIGLVTGLGGALMATPVLSAMLYEIDPHDPLTIGLVAVIVGGAAALACVLPAWRITREDPMGALRSH